MANQIQVSAISNTGRVRDNNEDNLYVSSQYMKQGEQGNFHLSKTIEANSFVCAVYDGMGGEKSGERASFEAVSRLHYAVSTTVFPDMTLPEKIQEINKYIGETNAAIYNMAAGSFDFKGMGTTFVCLVIAQNQAAAMNVGDSRVYLFRDGILKQLTRDHSESERLIRLGIITREQARGHKSRFMLNRHLGMPTEEGILEADTSEIIQLQKGDRFLLCSDGLTDMVEDEAIKNILASSIDTKEATQMLINEALKNGGKDNVTAVVLKFDNLNVIGSPSGFPIHSLHKISRKEQSLIVALIAAIIVIIILAVAFFGNYLISNTETTEKLVQQTSMEEKATTAATQTPTTTAATTAVTTAAATQATTVTTESTTASPWSSTSVLPTIASISPRDREYSSATIISVITPIDIP